MRSADNRHRRQAAALPCAGRGRIKGQRTVHSPRTQPAQWRGGFAMIDDFREYAHDRLRFCWLVRIVCRIPGPSLLHPWSRIPRSANDLLHYQSAGAFPTLSFCAEFQFGMYLPPLTGDHDRKIPRCCRADNLDLAMTRWAPKRKVRLPSLAWACSLFPGIAPL